MKIDLLFGPENWKEGHILALGCMSFISDVEEEWIADDPISCYNCRYRRWLSNGIGCMKGNFPKQMCL